MSREESRTRNEWNGLRNGDDGEVLKNGGEWNIGGGEKKSRRRAAVESGCGEWQLHGMCKVSKKECIEQKS